MQRVEGTGQQRRRRIGIHRHCPVGMHRNPAGGALQQPRHRIAVRAPFRMQLFRRRQPQVNGSGGGISSIAIAIAIAIPANPAGAGQGGDDQTADHILLAGPFPPALFQNDGIGGYAGVIPDGDIDPVFPPLGAVGGNGGGATQPDDGRNDRNIRFPQRHPPLPGGARHPPGGIGGHRLRRRIAVQKAGHRPIAVGNAGFQHRAGGAAHPQQPGQGVVAGAGHGQHGLRRRPVYARHHIRYGCIHS